MKNIFIAFAFILFSLVANCQNGNNQIGLNEKQLDSLIQKYDVKYIQVSSSSYKESFRNVSMYHYRIENGFLITEDEVSFSMSKLNYFNLSKLIYFSVEKEFLGDSNYIQFYFE